MYNYLAMVTQLSSRDQNSILGVTLNAFQFQVILSALKCQEYHMLQQIAKQSGHKNSN